MYCKNVRSLNFGNSVQTHIALCISMTVYETFRIIQCTFWYTFRNQFIKLYIILTFVELLEFWPLVVLKIFASLTFCSNIAQLHFLLPHQVLLIRQLLVDIPRSFFPKVLRQILLLLLVAQALFAVACRCSCQDVNSNFPADSFCKKVNLLSFEHTQEHNYQERSQSFSKRLRENG